MKTISKMQASRIERLRKAHTEAQKATEATADALSRAETAANDA